MCPFFLVLALSVSGIAAVAAEFSSKPALAFSLTATNCSFIHQLDFELILRIERNELGWEVGVYQRGSADSLLYPQHDWHGAFPCQLSAWTQQSQTFADERIISVRGRKSSVLIRLIDAKTAGDSGSPRFISGRVEIFFANMVPYTKRDQLGIKR